MSTILCSLSLSLGAFLLLSEPAHAITASEDDLIENGGFDVFWNRRIEPYNAERQPPFWWAWDTGTGKFYSLFTAQTWTSHGESVPAVVFDLTQGRTDDSEALHCVRLREPSVGVGGELTDFLTQGPRRNN